VRPEDRAGDPLSAGGAATRRQAVAMQIRELKSLLKRSVDPALRHTTRTTLRQLKAELEQLDLGGQQHGR